MSRRHITAAVAAAVLGLGAGACGEGDREGVDQSNPGEQNPQGGPSTQQQPATGITPTGETEPSVTQPEGGE